MWPPVKKWRHSKYKRKFGNFENSWWFSQLIRPCVHMKKYTGQQGVYEKNQLQWKFRKKSQNLQSHPAVFARYEKCCWARSVSLVLNRTWRYVLLLQKETFKIKKRMKFLGPKNVVNVGFWPPDPTVAIFFNVDANNFLKVNDFWFGDAARHNNDYKIKIHNTLIWVLQDLS